ncbi:hypothetical protein HDE_04614 [Halotydeus destructor]|nr:hypothetical protein HDE_04614 [Halotydeus destructor]
MGPPMSLQQEHHHYFHDPAIVPFSDAHLDPGTTYFEPFELDNVSNDERPPPLSKREKLDMLFDGHRIKNPFDGFVFFLRFSLFILLINKLILITTFLVQGRLFEQVNWSLVTPISVAIFVAFYLVSTLFYIITMPLPDNRFNCHIVLIISLVALSLIEILLNQTNSYVHITKGLNLIICSIAAFALLHLLCLTIRGAITCFTNCSASNEANDGLRPYQV